MKWALLNYDNTVQNLLVWDWVKPLPFLTTPRFQLVDDWINIGDDKNKPAPLPGTID